MNIREFQQDLQKGMTLEEALIKHNTNLQTVFRVLHYKDTNKNNIKKKTKSNSRSTGEAYIQYQVNQKSYLLRKTVNKKCTYFGRYETLEDAILVRDYMMTHGWDKSRLNSIRKELNV